MRFSDATIDRILASDGVDRDIRPVSNLRPDLVSLGNTIYGGYGDVYEIKPGSSYGLFTGSRQLAGYIALLDGYSTRRVFGPGKQWMPPTALRVGPNTCAYFRGPVNGVIYYHLNDAQDGAEAALIAASITALLVSAAEAALSGGLVAP